MAEKQYLGLKLAASAVDSISSLNQSRNKRRELWTKVLEAREENENTARIQSSKAWPQALSATLMLTASFAAGAMTTLAKSNANLNTWAEALKNLPQFAPLASNMLTAKKEGEETLSKAKVNELEANQHMKRNDNSNDDNLIGRIAEAATRSIHSLVTP
jgi:hypothetical protein